MRVMLQPGYILHRRPYRDSSQLLDVFSHDYGRIALVARGVRSTTGVGKRSVARSNAAQRAALLQPFVPLMLSWSGKGELGNLTDVEPATGTAGTVTTAAYVGERLLCALYVNELLLRLLERHDPYPELYLDYAQLLSELAIAETQAVLLRRFEKRLLDVLGYGLSLTHTFDTGEALRPEKRYLYHLERGPTASVHEQYQGIPISGQSLLALDDSRLPLDSPTVLRELKTLTRAALDVLLEHRPLKTRELLRDFRRKKVPSQP